MTTPIPPDTQLSDFRIGWVCIVKTEYCAALDVLDEKWSLDHDSSFGPESNTASDYELGRIGDHNVVINVPHRVKGGLLHAAEITSQMKSNFPYIRFILLVGIGGGAPAFPRNDIRLGDVVFGELVIPYKKGKELDDGFEIDPERLEPPQQLLTALTRLEARLDDEDPLEDTLDRIASKTARKKERYRRPADDCLLDSAVLHQGHFCECLHPGLTNSPRLISRQARPSTDHIKIHRGIIGSADQVLKSAQERDRLSREKNILCFEMEAAAVMRSTKCITIRGIADYADGHKNDDWHSYAALAAAVCDKKLLVALRPETVRGTGITISLEEFAVRFKDVTARINTKLGSKEKNAQDAFNNTEEAIDLHEDQTKLFTDFTLSQKVKDPQMKDMLESSQQVLQQQLEMLQEQVKRQRKENKNSDYVTREDWNSLKEKVEERKKHTKNEHLGFAQQYVEWAGRVIDWIVHLKRNSSHAPVTEQPEGVSHSSRSSTPNKPRKWDKWIKYVPGKRRDQSDPESTSPSPSQPDELIADMTQNQPSSETARSSADIAAHERRLEKGHDESKHKTPSPLLGTPPNQPNGVPIPPTHSPPPTPSRPKPAPSPKPGHLRSPSPGKNNRPPPTPVPSTQPSPTGGSSGSKSQSFKNLQEPQGTYQDRDSRLSFDEKMKRFQRGNNKDS
ncbi:hypothetical protein NW752_009202 [Fusarium irregulare]|uniref:Nucleoside phosphorylase domain-containing protein n=1 Tax=Fusarium irregulare TaxID=2494466 RepID=A0A9W8U6P2_9HYPO|nr:hypothetical protein NW766_008733 [Fusarium irregulare]KAJ4010025.1 hypothetical protein NW752_009202 [Fusarium irregulare]